MRVPPVAEVISFWRDAGPKRWFASDPSFDAEFRERFLDLHLAAARGDHDDRVADPDGALALALLLDQFPRNAFRDTPHMYGTDRLARELMRRAVDSGVSAQVDASLEVRAPPPRHCPTLRPIPAPQRAAGPREHAGGGRVPGGGRVRGIIAR